MTDLKTCRILVTPTSFGLHDATIRTELESQVGEVMYNDSGRPLTSLELIEKIPGVDGYIAGLDTIDHTVIEAADRLKVIARYGVGLDNIDLEAAEAKGIVVTNTPQANSISVAELAVGLILGLARSIVTASTATCSGGWPRLQGVSLEDKVVGLIGFGAIGRQVARRLAGFDCSILVYDPALDPTGEAIPGVEICSRERVVQEADFLSLHCPSLPETKGMVDAEFLKRMKPRSFLINTARGELIDETALVKALECGHLRGAALDVFQRQPPDPENPLLALPQVIATPHMGSHTDVAINNMGREALHDCLAVLRGERPKHPVKP